MCVSAVVVGPPSPISRAQVDVFLSQALADQLFLLQVRRPSPAGGQPLLRTCAVARGAGGVRLVCTGVPGVQASPGRSAVLL